MARTNITVTTLLPFFEGGTLVGVAGDLANGHDVEADVIERLHLLCANTHTSTVQFETTAPDVGEVLNFGSWLPAQVVPAAAAGIEGMRVVVLDNPAQVYDDMTFHINSTDANINLATFYGYTWTPSELG